MNVITYSCGQMLYSDGTTVMTKLDRHFKFDSIISVESNLNIERYGQKWLSDHPGGNLTLVNYHKDVMKLRFGGSSVNDMLPLSRELIEKLSLDRCHLYNMERDETLTFRQLDRHVLNCIQYWNHILLTGNVDLFICHGFPHSVYTYSLYAVCKAIGIKVLYIARACVQGYTYCHDDLFGDFTGLKKAYDSALEQEEPFTFSEYMQSRYIEPMETDSYKYISIGFKEKGHSSDAPAGKGGKYAARFGKLLRVNRWGQYYRGFRNSRKEKAIPVKTLKYYQRISGEADYSKRYIYVPLQMQPEATTSPMGNVFVDFVLMLKILSACVKDTGIMLYVKEHPDQKKWLRRSRAGLYDELAALPNVRLIRIEESSFKLQENCVVSATCSGTVVMESMFKYKPVLVFGTRIHNLAPSALVVSDLDSCKAALNRVLDGKFSIGKRERDAFLSAVEKVCFRACWFTRFSDLFGISQDDAAENTFAELRERIKELGIRN